MIYLKIINNQVQAYGDLESAQIAEQRYPTGKVYDREITEEQWETANYRAHIIQGEIVLGISDDMRIEELGDVIRVERSLKLRICDRISPLYWETLSDQEKDQCRAYRQALLDITKREGFPWDGDLHKVPWPDQPKPIAALGYNYQVDYSTKI